MSWVRVDDKFPDHPKVIAAGPLAKALYVDALCYCNRMLTDGFIPERKARIFADDYADFSKDDLCQRLVDVQLWELCDGGYRVHGYLEYQPSAEKVKAEQAANAKRQADWRERHAEERKQARNGTSNGVTNRERNASRNGPVTGAPTPRTSNVIPPTEVPPVVPPPEPTTPPPAPVKTEAKPRSEKQKAAGALYERRMAIVAAYFRGLEIREGTLPWNKGKNKALGALTVPILDSPECVPEIIEPLTRYTASAFAWRHGRRTPELSEVLTAFAEWDQLGRPAEVDRKSRAPTPMTQRPTQNGRVGYTPDELKAMARGEPYDQAGNGQAVIDTQFRVVR